MISAVQQEAPSGPMIPAISIGNSPSFTNRVFARIKTAVILSQIVEISKPFSHEFTYYA